jgi:hypothetical protein
MGFSNVTGKGKELGQSCGSKAPMMAMRDCEDGDKGLMGCGL